MGKTSVKTESERKRHRYASFKARIDNIHINPVRKVRKTGLDSDNEDELNLEYSNFNAKLSKWIELNTSSVFVEFIKKIRPISHTLPQLLHHQKEIFNEIEISLKKLNEYSIEPLLDLLSGFCQDLGTDFQPYYLKSLNILISLISHPSVNVVECVFNCLTFIFKYLSRFLIKNLVDTFDSIAPLLGRENSKPFIIRFTAEAFAFLLRKTKEIDLDKIISHIYNSLELNYSPFYVKGISILFSESMKNVDYSLQSRSPILLVAFIRNTLFSSFTNITFRSFHVLELTIIDLLHHTNKESATLIYDTSIDYLASILNDDMPVSNQAKIIDYLSIYITDISAFRKGSRVSNWTKICNLAKLILLKAKLLDPISNVNIHYSCARMSSSILSYCDDISAMQFHRELIEPFSDVFYSNDSFLYFCDLFSFFSKTRFQLYCTFFFAQYSEKHWDNNTMALSICTIKLSESNLLMSKIGTNYESFHLNASSTWFKNIIDNLSDVSSIDFSEESKLDEISMNLLLLKAVKPPKYSIINLLISLFDVCCSTKAFSINSNQATYHGIILGIVYELISNEEITTDFLQKNTLLKCSASLIKSYKTNVVLLSGFLKFLSKASQINNSNTSLLLEFNFQDLSIECNLSSPSHKCRLLSLEIISTFLKITNGSYSPFISQCLIVENIPIGIATSRNLSLQIRKLASLSSIESSNNYFDTIAIKYYIGLLMVQFTPIWNDVIECISKITERCFIQVWDLVSPLLFSNESISPSASFVIEKFFDTNENIEYSYNCSEVQKFYEKSYITSSEVQNPLNTFQNFLSKELCITETPNNIREQALKVLASIPGFAQRKSRVLTPLFISAFSFSVTEDEDNTGETVSSWSYKERIKLLELFTLFVNPKNLYKSNDLYETLLTILASNDMTIQKLALKCILTWKNQSLVLYNEHLYNLLNDKTFRDEIVNFLQPKENDSIIQESHKPDLYNIISRILYGRCSDKRKLSGASRGNRNIVFLSLSLFDTTLVKLFVDLSIKFSHRPDLFLIKEQSSNIFKANTDLIGELNYAVIKRLTGSLKMLENVIISLKTTLTFCAETVLESILYSAIYAQHYLSFENSEEKYYTALRELRLCAVKSLNEMFSSLTLFPWKNYINIIYEYIVSPRLKNFAVENLQQPSFLMQIFMNWASEENYMEFLSIDGSSILSAMIQCFSNPHVKPSVIEFGFDFVNAIIGFVYTNDKDTRGESVIAQTAASTSMICMGILDLIIKEFLPEIPRIILESSDNNLYFKEIDFLFKLTSVISLKVDKQVISQLLEAVTELIDGRLSTKMEVKLIALETLRNLISLSNFDEECAQSVYFSLSKLFKSFRQNSRQILIDTFISLKKKFLPDSRVYELIKDLNSYSNSKLNLPDFSLRLDAFSKINEDSYMQFSAAEWNPLLLNMLYFIKDPEELAIRASALFSIKRFIEKLNTFTCANSKDPEEQKFLEDFHSILVPSLKIGLRESSEAIRGEFISVLEHIVEILGDKVGFGDMKVLLFDGDKEANFFRNILHIQQHRRQRAILRLGKVCVQGDMTSASIAHYLLPIIEHFVPSTDKEASGIGEDSISMIGILCSRLTWNQFKAIINRYISNISDDPKRLRVSIRLLNASINAIDPEYLPKSFLKSVDSFESLRSSKKFLFNNFPSSAKLEQFVLEETSPKLLKILRHKIDSNDDSEEDAITYRVPISIPIVKLYKILDPTILETKLPGVLTGLCQVLRSKSSDIRDSVRKSLTRILNVLTFKYFSFVVLELKSALSRGYQRHILGYTIHFLLVDLNLDHGKLDSSAEYVMDIIMDDIFGIPGSEKEAEGYTNSMKEVKEQKSYDTVELLSQNISFSHMNEIISPIKTLLLYEKLDAKNERKVENLLRRIGLGLQHNKQSFTRDVLIMCYEIIKLASPNVYAEKKVSLSERMKVEAEEHYLVALKSKKNNTIYLKNLHLLTRFALDLLRSSLARHDNLKTVENLSQFVPILESNLESHADDVRLSVIRLFSIFIQLNIPELNAKSLDICNKVLVIIKQSPSTNTELVQASFKLLSTFIRYSDAAVLNEKALGYLLERVKDDIEEPDRQGIAFSFIKSTIEKKISIPEMYDVMDKVGEVMVTSQSKNTRNQSRNLYFKFLMEYPQGVQRLNKQYSFLINNLEYKYEAGRLNVMEVIYQLLDKVTDENIQGLIGTFYMSLVLVLVNDSSAKCKESAALLITKILERSDNAQLLSIRNFCSAWLKQRENIILIRSSLQIIGLYVEKLGIDNHNFIAMCKEEISDILSNTGDTVSEDYWEVIYFSLQLWSKISTASAEVVLSKDAGKIWEKLPEFILFPHSWVRLSVARLFVFYFSNIEALSFDNFSETKLVQIVRRFFRALCAPGISQELSTQISKNLVLIIQLWLRDETLFSVPTESDYDENNEDNGLIENALLQENDVEGNEVSSVSSKPKMTRLSWVINKLAYIIRSENNVAPSIIAKKSSIQILGSVMTLIPKEKLESVSDQIIRCLYFISEEADNNVDKEIKSLGDEAINMLQELIGTSAYAKSYASVHQGVIERRIERKHKRAVEMVSHPEIAYNKKIKKHKKSRESQKKKTDKFRLRRLGMI